LLGDDTGEATHHEVGGVVDVGGDGCGFSQG
jgi:hypothetical protein